MCQTWIPPDATGITPGIDPQSWSKKMPRVRFSGIKGSRIMSDPAQRRLAIAFEFAHHGAGVQMIAARQAQALGQHAEMDAVMRVAVEHRMHGAVNVQQHAVFAAPVRKPRVAR